MSPMIIVVKSPSFLGNYFILFNIIYFKTYLLDTKVVLIKSPVYVCVEYVPTYIEQNLYILKF